MRDAWRTEFIGADGRLRPDTQANHVRALAFGLVPAELRSDGRARLVELIRAADTHLATGFLATPYLLPVLADAGHLDVAYELLFTDTMPSWLYMIDRGATTVWERWDGVRRRRHAVRIAQPLLEGCGRLVPAPLRRRDPAARRRRPGVPPLPRRSHGPVAGSRGRRAEHDSPYGRIESAWRLSGDAFELVVTVPPGTTAKIVLPDGTTETVSSGHHTLGGSAGNPAEWGEA